jgi:hypothetical protein
MVSRAPRGRGTPGLLTRAGRSSTVTNHSVGTEWRQGIPARAAQRHAGALDRPPLRQGGGRHVGLAARAPRA